MAFCTECGTNVPEDVRFCTSCGKPMGAIAAAATPTPEAQPAPQAQPMQAAQPVQQPKPVAPAAPAYTPPVQQSAFAEQAPAKGGKYAVMGVLGYIGTFILFAIPIVGLIFEIKWAFGGGNLNRRNLARAYLIFTVLAIILSVFAFIALSAVFNNFLNALRDATDGQFGNWQDIFDQFKGVTDSIPSIPGQ